MAAVDSFSLLYREIARSCSFYYETLALVGVLYTASKAVALLRNCCSLVRVHFLPRIFTNKKLSHRFGDWAVIYDSAAPVALAYAEELARQGVSIIFITVDPNAARDTAAFLPQAYGVETVVILADFSKDQSALKVIQEVIRDKDIGFLVNCVEEALTQPQNLMEVNEESLMGAVNKNTTVMTLMTRLVLPGMLQRSRGAVVNITTGACCKPLPGRVMLTASMGYLDHFSRALYLEYSSKGIFIQSLTPFQIASTRRNLKEGLFVPKPQVYAQHAISTLGVSNWTTGYWPHTLQYGLITCIPDWIWILGSRLFIS
ncbi:inactive hydroxysteroid dehydrogenase-like protein 1 [Periophthalmus magnuspinnatus]|uniref:inactive hydroxysteroid dehydrogenase-like protein 1 n=1 Tax=Periophthalmus magnuspinnatus TaxID=409849 RepID=UPI00145A93B4|nr:inactive hydroxysteroid dehydrogenase-like protein 1 [Periophthalmus magnuspinnatus]